MAVNNIIKRIQNIMRSDAGVNGDAQRIEQMTWMFFLKVYDTQEETWEYKAYKDKKQFTSIIPEPLRWRNWAVDEKDGNAMTGDALLNFINNVLFPVIKGQNVDYNGETIKGIVVTAETPRSKSIVQETFADLNQYMKDGTLLRQVVNIVNEIEFDDADDRHTFGDIYEGILKDLQSAGNAGEFYTPRALTDLIVRILDPKLGETFGDFTSGTGGFLVSTLNHLAPQVKSAADYDKLQRAVMGQEWKPLPYLLSITNLLLHDIESPNIRHCDSLGTNVGDFKESDKVDVVGMNPPYGGSTGTSVQSNFPSAYRSSETADLFIALIMYRLKVGGRCGVIIPDGFLFGTDGAKLALKEALLRKFNLHTIVRLPGSIFSPYTSIATNILFFNNDTAEGAAEGFKTKETWFYRLDMPEGYKHFSKTKPMRMEHTQPLLDWWNDRKEIISDELGEKSKVFTAQQLLDLGCNFDQCKFPKEEEVILGPEEFFSNFQSKSDKYLSDIYGIMGKVKSILNNEEYENLHTDYKSFAKLSLFIKNVPEALKRTILQEAIKGKLVEQIPSEGSALDILNRIEEENRRLIKEKIIKKKDILVDEILEEDIPYIIPDNWTWVRLKVLCNSFIVPQRDKPIQFNGDIPWCRIEDIEGKYLHGSKSNQLVTKELADSMNMHICPKGTVICACSASIGNQAITTVDCYTNQTFIGIVCKEYALYNEYLYYFFMSQRQALKDLGKGTTISYISRKKFEDYLFPLPPLAEQHRIVAKIEEIFNQLK